MFGPSKTFIYYCNIFSLWYRVLEKFYVGELVDNEMPVFPQQRYALIQHLVQGGMLLMYLLCSEFYKVLKGRVEKYFKENNIVSQSLGCCAGGVLMCVSNSGSQDRLLDVHEIYRFLSYGQPWLVWDGEYSIPCPCPVHHTDVFPL
jgi:hypothetical protein